MRINRTKAHGRDLSTRMQRQRDLRQQDLEAPDKLLLGEQRPGGLFKSVPRHFESVDELITAGNQKFDNLDAIDFTGFRNNKELGSKVLKEVRSQVHRLHRDSLPWSKAEQRQVQRDIRRVVHARYLQGHGVQLKAKLNGDQLAGLRKYLQTQDTSYNAADAVRGINQALAQGISSEAEILRSAEKHLFKERGVSAEVFDNADQLQIKELRSLRDFSDAWSTSQGGKYLPGALKSNDNLDGMLDSMAREMLGAHGYVVAGDFDLTTVLSLLRDVDPEGPRTNATMRHTINQAVMSGERDYFELSRLGNEAILKELGVETAQLAVNDEALLQAYPEVSAPKSRAIRTRVLRDLTRVLPDGERKTALDALQDSNLVAAEKDLAEHFSERIAQLAPLPNLDKGMGPQQKANLLSALSRLPESLRQGLGSDEAAAKDTLEAAITSEFSVNLHRTPGVYPGNAPSYAPFVSDWTIQGLADLYNGLASMSRDGQLPPGLGATTTLIHMVGAPSGASMTPGVELPDSEVGPYGRPGAWAHASGKSGFFGEATYDKRGHDLVVLYDDALYAPNGDGSVGITTNEATLVHELGHAMQLGGVPDAPAAVRRHQEQTLVAEWSSLSRWHEADSAIADGYIKDFNYYYDPAVQVRHRDQVATSYGASDPVEDFAEFSPFFFRDPQAAMELSVPKFLYFNHMMGEFYDNNQVREVGDQVGLSTSQLVEAEDRLLSMLERAPEQARIAAG